MTARAPSIYLLIRGMSAFAFFLAEVAMGVYFVTVIGLTPLQLVLVGTALEATVFLFEVPTGVVADVYSRRLSIIVGMFLMGAGFVVWGFFPIFAAALLGQALWGLGTTFTSGAEAAWISDEVGEAHVARLFVRGLQAEQIGGLVGIALGAVLGSLRLHLPILVGGILYIVLGAVLIFVMPERGFVPRRHQHPAVRPSFRQTLTAGFRTVRGQSVLVVLLAVAALHGMASEAFDRLWEAHFLKNLTFPVVGHFQPIIWIGAINVGVLLLSVVAGEFVHRRLDVTRPGIVARALLVCNALIIVGMVSFALAPAFGFAAGAYWVANVARRIRRPLYDAWLNRGLDPAVRATVLSMGGQADALGQIAGGPVLGLAANAWSIRAAIAIAGVILWPAFWLYNHALRRTPGGRSSSERQGI
jgi:DHA3 family tetracycline resistance protein-like MFS transporter